MKLIIGLGNPGAQYQRTRHNVGYMAVDRLQQRHAPEAIARSRFHSWTVEARLPAEDGDEGCMLVKPMTYMNRSGQAVAEAVRFYKIDLASDLLVIVDDIYLSAGIIRMRSDGGASGHNGLADIQRVLATSTYARLRIGIDDPGQIHQADYVLGRFTDEQWPEVDAAIDRAVGAAEVWVRQGAASAMNQFNQRQTPPKPSIAADKSESSSRQESTDAAASSELKRERESES